jgi:uncharacterized protein YidB (DUF937 family)
MDLLGKITNAVAGKVGREVGKEAAGGMLSNILGGGGLKSIVDKFSGAGLSSMSSWIGKGENMPVSSDQISKAFGSEGLQDIAGKLGLPADQISGLLAQHLPGAIDQMTPDGTMPTENA